MEQRRAEDAEVPGESAGTPDQAEWEVVDDAPPDVLEYEAPGTAEPGDARMSAVRVRQLSAERRGAYRLRSYCVIGLGLCLVLGVQLAAMTITGARAAGFGPRQIGYACGAAAAGMAASYLARRALDLTRELRKPAQDAPAAPPDFSTLSDGSQHWKNLEEMRRGT